MPNNTTKVQEHLSRWGLHSGQVRTRRITRGCQWYDKYGNRLGFGDLNTVDLRRIAADLGPEDLFLAVENQSALAAESDLTGPQPITVGELVKRSSYAITQGRVCHVVDQPDGITVLDGQLMLWPLTREVLRRKLLLTREAAIVVNN